MRLIDFHCHILAGLDDGAQDLADSLALARQCVSAGVTHVVTTPHGSSEGLESLLAKRDTALASLRSALREEGLELELIPGLEYHADGHSMAAAMESPSCLCGEPGHTGRPLLVELPFEVELSLAANLLFMAQVKGVTMILAHPERYSGFTKATGMLKELMDKGMYLQFNSSGFRGGFFSHATPRAMLELVKHSPEHVLVGSDAHNPESRPAGLEEARLRICERLGESVWGLVSAETPSRLLGLPPATA